MTSNNADRLIQALRRQRRPPLDLTPQTPFEQALITRLAQIEHDVERLATQLDRLIWLIAATFLAFVISQLLR